MVDAMSRVGQVWDLDGSVELIIASEAEERYLTLVLATGCSHPNKFDRVAESSLAMAEEDELMTRYKRIA